VKWDGVFGTHSYAVSPYLVDVEVGRSFRGLQPLSIDLLTRQTPQLMADMRPSAFCCRDPMALSPGRIMSDVGVYCSVPDGGVVGALSASLAARLANFFCSRRSAFARRFSCLLSSFWRFWNVMLKGLLRSPLLFYLY